MEAFKLTASASYSGAPMEPLALPWSHWRSHCEERPV